MSYFEFFSQYYTEFAGAIYQCFDYSKILGSIDILLQMKDTDQQSGEQREDKSENIDIYYYSYNY